MHKITSLELLRTPILCLVQLSKLWECEATDAQKLLSQWEKVAKCNFKSKAQVHEKCFFLMKWTVFCNAEDRFSWVWAFLQKKSFWSLNAQNHFFRASKNTNSVFSATKQIMRMRGPQTAQKLLSQWEKVAKCNFKSKAQVHEKCSSNEMNSFLQCRRQIFMSLSFFAEKVILELKCTKSLL